MNVVLSWKTVPAAEAVVVFVFMIFSQTTTAGASMTVQSPHMCSAQTRDKGLENDYVVNC